MDLWRKRLLNYGLVLFRFVCTFACSEGLTLLNVCLCLHVVSGMTESIIRSLPLSQTNTASLYVHPSVHKKFF